MDMVTLMKSVGNAFDMAATIVEGNAKDDAARGELVTPDKFSRGYALGYAHAMQAVYDMFPDWVHNQG